MRLARSRVAAKVWAFRKHVEDQAARTFIHHAQRLRRIAAPAVVIGLAERAAVDERDHSERCAAICEELGGDWIDLLAHRQGEAVFHGPEQQDDRSQALYISVAACCVTETLATALLIEIRRHAAVPLVHETATQILRDEVQHARLGWAHLAWEAARSDVSWLAPCVPKMVEAALTENISTEPVRGLSDYGVLDSEVADRVIRDTLVDVIYPGLSRFGVLRSVSDHVRAGHEFGEEDGSLL